MKKISFVFGLIAAAALTSHSMFVEAKDTGNKIVQIESGALQGGVSDGIYTYFGVPYAEAHERFVPAEKLTPWSGVRKGTEYGP